MREAAARGFILDASIAMKWYLNDEDHTELADRVLFAFRENQVSLYAPEHIHYEVANALRSAIRRGRLSEELGSRAITEFLEWKIPTVQGHALVLGAFEVARRYGCAFYDGLYVALAEDTGLPLLHADRRLRSVLNGTLPNELWIKDVSLIL